MPRNIEADFPRPKLDKHWEDWLASQGMPAELKSAVDELSLSDKKILDEAGLSPISAALEYARTRRDVHNQTYGDYGGHDRFAAAIADKFSIPHDEAREIVDQALTEVGTRQSERFNQMREIEHRPKKRRKAA